MRRPHIGIIVIASSLALAACAPAGLSGPTPTPTPTPSTPVEPTVERRALMAYPDQPSPAWTFTVQDSGVDADGGDLTFVDPTLISDSVDGFKPPTPIDAGDTLVIAVEGGDARYTLVGVDADTGEARWSYAPEQGQVTACAQHLLGSAIACGIYDHETESDAAVVLVAADTGQEVVRAELPAAAVALAVVGNSVLSLTSDPAGAVEGEPEPYDVSAHDAAGELQWSTEVVKEPNDFGRGRSEKIYAGTALTAVELSGSVFVLATDGGDVLLERDGFAWGWYWAGNGDGLLYDSAPDGEPEVTVVATDGSEVATLPDLEVLSPALEDESTSTYFLDSDRQVVSVNNGTTDGTGATPAGTPGPSGFVAAPSVFEVDGTLVLLTDTSLAGHLLSDPGPQAWERDVDGWFGGLTDGTTLYAGGIGPDGDAAEGDLVLSALDPADGSLAWTLGVTDPDRFTTLVRGGGRLIVMDPTSMTALAP